MGDKIRAKELVAAAGVPLLETLDAATRSTPPRWTTRCW